MMNRKILLMGGISTMLLLAACHKHSTQDKQPQKTPQAQAPVDIKNNDNNAGGDLSNALNQKSTQGGVLAITPRVLLTDVPAGESIRRVITLMNQGDDTMGITSIMAQGNPIGLNFSGTCSKPGIQLLPQQSCDLLVVYRDSSGENLNTVALISTTSKRNPMARFDIGISVRNSMGNQLDGQQVPNPDGAPQNNRYAPPPMSASEQAWAQRVAAAQQARFNGGGNTDDSNNAFAEGTLGKGMRNGDNIDNGQGANGSSLDITPTIQTRDSEPRYDPNRMPWTESTLKVNRHYILTADRIIPAVIERPISALMCNNVTAVVDQNVYSPDSDNILIPAGTRALGHCSKFTDERTNVEWYRMITPNGVNITFNKLQADTGDAMGQGGVPGRIVQKDADRYAAPILESAIDIASSIARGIVGQNQTTSYNNLSGQQSNSESKYDTAIDDFTQRGRNTVINGIQSLLDQRRNAVVAPGTRIEIQPQEDIYFKTPTQVIRLADYEYEIQKQYMPPTAVERPAPTLTITPQIGPDAQGNTAQTIVVDGHTYTIGQIQEAPKQAAGAGFNGGTMQPNSAANSQGFYNGNPSYASQNPAYGRGAASSTYGGIGNLNQSLAAGYSGPGGTTTGGGSNGSGSFGSSSGTSGGSGRGSY